VVDVGVDVEGGLFVTMGKLSDAVALAQVPKKYTPDAPGEPKTPYYIILI
jgi:hypothetical protein